MNETLYTPLEVAQKLKVTKDVIYKWLRSGTLKGVKVGRYWRVKSSDLDEFLK